MGGHKHLSASQGALWTEPLRMAAGCFLWCESVAGTSGWLKGQDEVSSCWRQLPGGFTGPLLGRSEGGILQHESGSRGMMAGWLSCRAVQQCGYSTVPAQGAGPARAACPLLSLGCFPIEQSPSRFRDNL